MVRRSSTCGTLHRNWHGVYGVQSDSPFWIISSSCSSFITSTRNNNNKRLRSSPCSFSFFFLSRAPSPDMDLVLGHSWLLCCCTMNFHPSNMSPSSRHIMDLYYRRSYLLIFTHGWLFAAAVLFFYISAALFVLLSLLTSIN